jgi:hypothetical protein
MKYADFIVSSRLFYFFCFCVSLHHSLQTPQPQFYVGKLLFLWLYFFWQARVKGKTTFFLCQQKSSPFNHEKHPNLLIDRTKQHTPSCCSKPDVKGAALLRQSSWKNLRNTFSKKVTLVSMKYLFYGWQNLPKNYNIGGIVVIEQLTGLMDTCL